MSYRVHHHAGEDARPGPAICPHHRPTIQEAWRCAQQAAQRNGGDRPVIYDVETDRLLDAFEIEDAHRQDNDDWPSKSADYTENAKPDGKTTLG